MTLAAAFLIGGGFAIWFVFGLIVGDSEEIVKLQSEQLAIETQRNRFSEMTKEYESLKDSVLRLDSVLLDSNDKLSFIMLVERLSAEALVDHVIEAVAVPDVSKKEKEPSEEAIIFNINVAGEFPNVLKFIYALESAPYYVNIERVQLSEGSIKSASSGQGPVGPGVVKAQMSVKVYSK